MRNLVGAAASLQFTDTIRAALGRGGIEPEICRAEKDSNSIQELRWPGRLLVFNKMHPLVRKNIDAIFLNTEELAHNIAAKQVLNDLGRYLACGELKGGIDPAGADEHWKTANSALERIRTQFNDMDMKPSLFFCGAAIADAMGKEIFEQLKDGRLSYAANLTVPQQVDDLATWLVTL